MHTIKSPVYFAGTMVLLLLLNSCATPDEKFGIWLGKNNGEWIVDGISEQEVEYISAQDSINGAQTNAAGDIGTFTFNNGQGTLAYNFEAPSIGRDIQGEGERIIVGSEFYFLDVTDPNTQGETVRTTMIGYESPKNQLRIDMRLESYNIQNQLYLVHKMGLALRRSE